MECLIFEGASGMLLSVNMQSAQQTRGVSLNRPGSNGGWQTLALKEAAY